MSLQVHYICWTINNLLHLIQLLFCHRSTMQFASHIDNTTELPGYGSHVHTIFDTVATLPLYTVQRSNTLSHKSTLVGELTEA